MVQSTLVVSVWYECDMSMFVCVCHTDGDTAGGDTHRWLAGCTMPKLRTLCAPLRNQRWFAHRCETFLAS